MKRTLTLALVTGILFIFLLVACTSPTSPPPTGTLVPTPTQWMPPTAIPTLQSTPTPTSSPIPVPWPTLIPTVDLAVLPDLLGAAFTVQQESGANGHTLRRVTGWEYGLRSSDYGRPYRWLNSTHLLLFPLVGEQEDEMFGAVERTLPVVVDLNSGAAWLPALNRDSYPKPIWSDALQVLIVAQEGEILLLSADGHAVQRYPDSTPPDIGIATLHLSPSGRRLLVGFVWHDLETGQIVDFSGQHKWTMGNPGWSSDETRLFDCCFGYGDAQTGQYGYFELGELHQVGRSGPFEDFGSLSSRWVLSDTRVLVEWDFFESDEYGVIPLIDPLSQTYEDVRVLAGMSTDAACRTLKIAPDGGSLLVRCQTKSYLVDLHTFFTQSITDDLSFDSWSPDSQFVLLVRNLDWETQRGEYWLLPATGGDLHPVAGTWVVAPVWSPQGRSLAFLAGDARTLAVLDAETWMTRQVPLPGSATGIFWNPQGGSLAVQSADGSLWWIPDPAVDHAKQLTPPLPMIRDVRWSPDGERLAFVSATDLYVVDVR
ncbi:MAG: hypothetical protein SWK90_08855 [Chloroflexota bacterium]|nr:hypothetical protein [Chloroflexota bacterium]